MDKSMYLSEIMRQLNDTSIYHTLPRDPTFDISRQINTILLKYSDLGVLDQKTCDFLSNKNPITLVFYTLPKVHKNLEKPPGRQIVASTDSILSPLAVFLEKILTPLIQKSKSFILDTGAFLSDIQHLQKVPQEALLVTLDVKDLYTSIPHSDGINSTARLLTSTGMDVDQIHLCIDLLHLVLTSNFFLFQDDFYLQVRGTAMGSNVAPPYANAYMADFEESIIYKNDLFRNYAILWKRYIDDVFCIWGGSLESLLSFFDILNSSWPGIQFTIGHDLWRMNFLDTMVIKDPNGFLSTDLYIKSTDRNSLLHFESLHPPSTKRAIPKSQYQRVKRIVTNTDTRTLCLDEMTNKFVERGYPPSLLEASRDTPTRSHEGMTNRIPFVHTFHPFAYIIHKSIRKNWHLLSTAHPDVREFQKPFLPCFKRAPNLKDSLVKADIGPKSTIHKQRFLHKPKMGTFPCLHCVQCNNVLKGDKFVHPHSGKEFKISNFFTCDSAYVIYLIKCPCCLLYVGETSQPIRDRISKHKSTIRCKNILPIPHHVITQGHNISQLRFQSRLY
ncbi:decapping and exoribonuclease protein isoform X1 [Dendrobates tinctorius]|uniref:decapping and exoribonuclease protein isoform X1 n=1 Tax=Dendrobates tinctorius TaxID=92724 RepID=UPI003CC93538